MKHFTTSESGMKKIIANTIIFIHIYCNFTGLTALIFFANPRRR